MEYNKFKEILNKSVFNEIDSKKKLLEAIAKQPSRFVGLFRSTLPKMKLMQNLTQSQEIRFGDAFELLIREYLAENGYKNLARRYKWQGNDLDIDQCFEKGNKFYFAEQKLRDDHDSTKKVGQFNNFENKIDLMMATYGNNVEAFMFFVDPDMTKNENYYKKRLDSISNVKKISMHICYGKPFYEALSISHVWEEIVTYLETWREEIPAFPELNFDLEPEKAFEQIKEISANDLKKLFSNDLIFNEIILTIFPQKTTLYLLLEHFDKLLTKSIHTLNKSERKNYQEIYTLLKKRL